MSGFESSLNPRHRPPSEHVGHFLRSWYHRNSTVVEHRPMDWQADRKVGRRALVIGVFVLSGAGFGACGVINWLVDTAAHDPVRCETYTTGQIAEDEAEAAAILEAAEDEQSITQASWELDLHKDGQVKVCGQMQRRIENIVAGNTAPTTTSN